jgi:phosphate acyltransferase
MVGAVTGALATLPDGGAEAVTALAPLAVEMDPESTGGAILLGVDGVCVISHGSSSATAILNAVAVARDLVEADLVAELAAAVAPSP